MSLKYNHQRSNLQSFNGYIDKQEIENGDIFSGNIINNQKNG